jgi:hypothetical protein
MEEDLVARLLGDDDLSALVADRINWIERPQAGSLPSITLQVITSGRSYHMKGADGTAGTRVQADCWGRSYLEAKKVSRALTAAMEQAGVQGSTRFSAAFLDNASDFPPEDLPGGTKAYRVNMDWIVWNSPA